jgi:GNAT superfamily N-acetyltransferase
VIETRYRPGLIGEIAAAHGRYYSQHWGFGSVFEAKVARECAGFCDRMGQGDLILSAWTDSHKFAGSLILDLHDPEAGDLAHLRWFIVTEPGKGLGRAMMARAVAHLDQTGKSCFLTTFKGLDQARHLYEDFAFACITEQDGETWGVTVTEQRFERFAPR